MSGVKKGIAIVSALGLLVSVPMAASAASNVNTNVSTTAKVSPKASFSLNFNSIQFTGTVGDSSVAPDGYYQNSTQVTSPNYQVKVNKNYSVLLSGKDFSTADKSTTVTIKRLSVSVDSGAAIPVTETSAPTQIDQSSVGVNASKAVSFKLDLTDSGNSYTDNATLTNLTADTDLSTDITFAFTGL